MAYAEFADVAARAGRAGSGWSRDSTPGQAEIERMIDDVAGEIDVAVASQGFGVPIVDETAMNGLRSMNADGALVLALDATYQGGSAPAEVAKVRDAAEARYNEKLAQIAAGTLGAIVYLHSLSGQSAAANFWSEEPHYGLEDMQRFPGDDNPSNAPYISRAEPF